MEPERLAEHVPGTIHFLGFMIVNERGNLLSPVTRRAPRTLAEAEALGLAFASSTAFAADAAPAGGRVLAAAVAAGSGGEVFVATEGRPGAVRTTRRWKLHRVLKDLRISRSPG